MTQPAYGGIPYDAPPLDATYPVPPPPPVETLAPRNDNGDYLAAVRAETSRTGIDVPFDGDTYHVDGAEDWPIEAVEAIENDRIITGLHLLLGEEQWIKFRRTHKTVGDLNRLFTEMQRIAGAPNSAASTT